MRPARPALLAVAAAVVGGAAPVAHGQAIAPHASWGTLPWSNGVAAAAFDTVSRRLISFREHLYARRDAATATRELAYDAYFGVRTAGHNQWLTARPLDRAGWDGAAGIVLVSQTVDGVRITQRYFSPFAVTAPVVVAVVDVENLGAAPLADAALFSLANLRLGAGDDGTVGERITWAGGAFEERGARGLMVHAPLPAPTRHAASPDNPFGLVNAGGHLVDTVDSGVRDDAVAGFEWDLTGLAPGATRRVAVVYGFDAAGQRGTVDAAIAAAGGTADQLLADAQADWAAFAARAQVPAGLTVDERAVYDRQLAVLRMGQVREPGRGRGALVASLPPGMWNIAWVRDQAFALWALVDAGLDAEARAALDFWMGAQAGGYVCCDRDGGPWVGAPYQLSVVRYFGDGSEESDSDGRGPNVEFDGFGLALATVADYVEATGDVGFVTANADALFARTADVLVGLIEPSGPAQGLIRADSSIWESHWYDGGRQHWTFTQATSVVGLRAAARLAERVGRAADADRYRAAAATVAAAVAATLITPDGVARASLEQPGASLDAAAVALFRFGVVPPDGAVARATLDAWRVGLWNPLTGHGYRRNDDGGPYDEREWIAVDLWLADALREAGRAGEADALVAWVTAQARLNFDVLPENFDKVTADFQGEVPMVGFGAGAYVSSLWRRDPRPDPVDAGTDVDAGPDGGTASDGGAGGCCGAGGQPPALALVLVLAALARRRYSSAGA
ncbi:MAG: hypothetical protein R3B06_19015 [Kofleriaceae bacterium]